MGYERKTKDVYILLSNYGYGWEEEIEEDTYKEIRQRIKEYRENTNGQFKIKRKRIPIEKELKKVKEDGFEEIADALIDKQEFNGLPKSKNVAITILDIFEDMLSEKDVMIPDDDREGDEDEGCIYGTTYYDLEDQIVEILKKHYPEV